MIDSFSTTSSITDAFDELKKRIDLVIKQKSSEKLTSLMDELLNVYVVSEAAIPKDSFHQIDGQRNKIAKDIENLFGIIISYACATNKGDILMEALNRMMPMEFFVNYGEIFYILCQKNNVKLLDRLVKTEKIFIPISRNTLSTCFRKGSIEMVKYLKGNLNKIFSVNRRIVESKKPDKYLDDLPPSDEIMPAGNIKWNDYFNELNLSAIFEIIDYEKPRILANAIKVISNSKIHCVPPSHRPIIMPRDIRGYLRTAKHYNDMIRAKILSKSSDDDYFDTFGVIDSESSSDSDDHYSNYEDYDRGDKKIIILDSVGNIDMKTILAERNLPYDYICEFNLKNPYPLSDMLLYCFETYNWKITKFLLDKYVPGLKHPGARIPNIDFISLISTALLCSSNDLEGDGDGHRDRIKFLDEFIRYCGRDRIIQWIRTCDDAFAVKYISVTDPSGNDKDIRYGKLSFSNFPNLRTANKTILIISALYSDTKDSLDWLIRQNLVGNKSIINVGIRALLYKPISYAIREFNEFGMRDYYIPNCVHREISPDFIEVLMEYNLVTLPLDENIIYFAIKKCNFSLLKKIENVYSRQKKPMSLCLSLKSESDIDRKAVLDRIVKSFLKISRYGSSANNAFMILEWIICNIYSDILSEPKMLLHCLGIFARESSVFLLKFIQNESCKHQLLSLSKEILMDNPQIFPIEIGVSLFTMESNIDHMIPLIASCLEYNSTGIMFFNLDNLLDSLAENIDSLSDWSEIDGKSKRLTDHIRIIEFMRSSGHKFKYETAMGNLMSLNDTKWLDWLSELDPEHIANNKREIFVTLLSGIKKPIKLNLKILLEWFIARGHRIDLDIELLNSVIRAKNISIRHIMVDRIQILYDFGVINRDNIALFTEILNYPNIISEEIPLDFIRWIETNSKTVISVSKTNLSRIIMHYYDDLERIEFFLQRTETREIEKLVINLGKIVKYFTQSCVIQDFDLYKFLELLNSFGVIHFTYNYKFVSFVCFLIHDKYANSSLLIELCVKLLPGFIDHIKKSHLDSCLPKHKKLCDFCFSFVCSRFIDA